MNQTGPQSDLDCDDLRHFQEALLNSPAFCRFAQQSSTMAQKALTEARCSPTSACRSVDGPANPSTQMLECHSDDMPMHATTYSLTELRVMTLDNTIAISRCRRLHRCGDAQMSAMMREQTT